MGSSVLIAWAILGLGAPIGWSGCAREPVPAPPRAPGITPRNTQADWVGVASCAAAGCHGGTGPATDWTTAYTTWVRDDPHARAYEALLGERSDRIAERLAVPLVWGPACPPDRDPRCLDCHVRPGEAVAPHAPTHSRLDGVGCEACHGPAQCWLEPHAQSSWQRKTDAEKVALGMTPTWDLAIRARGCVACHVGGPGREVDHEMIAAGHPRLNFELTVFLANLPKHWDVAAEKLRQPDLEARAWMVGQLVSARASVAMLRAHATTAKADPSRWPEFVDYDCFACHHDLMEPSWRARRSTPAGLRPGGPRWGAWYLSMPEFLAGAPMGLGPVAPRSLVDALRRSLCRRAPDPEAVEALAEQAVRAFDLWIEASSRSPTLDPGRLRTIADRLVRESPDLALDWDPAAQVGLALAALAQALADQHQPLDPGTPAALQELTRLLQFPDGYASPRGRGPLIPGPFGEILQRVKPGTR